MKLGNLLLWFGLVSGAISLAISFPNSVSGRLAENYSLLTASAKFFTYFTNWTNILVVCVYLGAVLSTRNSLALFRTQIVKGAAFASIIMVMIVYHLLLSATHNPAGIGIFTNIIMHYVAPMVYVAWWFIGGRDGTLVWRDLWKFTIFPVAYVVFTYSTAPFAGEYPYNFLNIEKNGVTGVAPIIGAIVILILLLAAIATTSDRRVSKAA